MVVFLRSSNLFALLKAWSQWRQRQPQTNLLLQGSKNNNNKEDKKSNDKKPDTDAKPKEAPV
ncbi:hypothetical protein OIU78_001527, partial [Salix suchowensis]